jgi:serine/threonine protein kinase
MEALGKYKIESKLGQGAMGCVYKAWHPGFHDYVSLKTIQDTRLENAQLLERFKREGRALAKLKHQNIVQIYDADQADGVHFIVMEYMNGGSLDRIIEMRDHRPLAMRLGYIVPACHALSYAHRRGLFHRDIKPANIMLHNDGNEEVVKVVDFGIARLVDLSDKQDFSISQTSLLVGSPAYMAPELLTGSCRANERTDIWALGVTLFELLSFERPFQGKNFEELRHNVIHSNPESLLQLAPDCPGDLIAVVLRMIEKEPSRRYQVVDDLLLDLEPIARRLRTETVASLIHRANDLCEIGEMESAKSVLSEARNYDPANSQLRELLQKIEKELHRKELLPRLHTHLKRARDFAHLDEYQNAREEIGFALALDSTFEPARKYLDEIDGQAKKKEVLQEKLRQIKLRISEGELSQAEIFLKELDEISAGNPKSLELRRQIEQEKQQRLKRKRMNEILSGAQSLLAALQEDECLALLNQGLLEYPQEPEFLKMQEMVRRDVADSLSQIERQRSIDEIRQLVGNCDWEAAHRNMEQLLQKFPNDSVVANLQSFVAQETGKLELSDQSAAADEGTRSNRKDVRASKPAGAAAATEMTFSETRTLLANGKRNEALKLAQRAIEARVFKKNDARVVALLNDIQNFKGSPTEPLQGGSRGSQAAVEQPPETELPQQTPFPSEIAAEVASDWRLAVPSAENDARSSAAPVLAEYKIELPVTEAGGSPGAQNFSGEIAPPDGTPAKSRSNSGMLYGKAKQIGVLTSILALVAIALIIRWRIANEDAKQEIAAFHQAAEDEGNRKWPKAAGEYHVLEQGHGGLAVQAGNAYTRLTALLQKEKDLEAAITQAKVANSYEHAATLLGQLADLHGDLEDQAREEMNEIAQGAQREEEALRATREAAKLAQASRPATKESTRKSAASTIESKPPINSSCELSASDLLVRLSRADRNSAQGNYESAEREYLAVLACEPNNEQARTGLERTRKAKSM